MGHNGNGSLPLNKIHQKKGSKKNDLTIPRTGQSGELLRISEEVSMVKSAAAKAASGLDDVRENKVRKVQEEIEIGTFEIDSKKIAKAMLEE